MHLTRAHSLVAAAALVGLSAQAPAASVPWCTRIPLPATAAQACVPLTIRTPHGTLRLAVAATESQRERGLMNVSYVPPLQGMIFAFPDGDDDRGFWMKDTITPLDMVFVTSDGTITSVAVDVPATPPHTPDEKVARRSGLAHYVIELGAGQAGAMGLLPGARLVIPAVQAR
jgi:hypothetical protein